MSCSNSLFLQKEGMKYVFLLMPSFTLLALFALFVFAEGELNFVSVKWSFHGEININV